jgi:hypothetical protein
MTIATRAVLTTLCVLAATRFVRAQAGSTGSATLSSPAFTQEFSRSVARILVNVANDFIPDRNTNLGLSSTSTLQVWDTDVRFPGVDRSCTIVAPQNGTSPLPDRNCHLKRRGCVDGSAVPSRKATTWPNRCASQSTIRAKAMC